MSRLLISMSTLLIALSAVFAHDEEPAKLLGSCSTEQLEVGPFAEWYSSGRGEYTPNGDVLDALRAVDVGDVEISVFFGTWCGDSRRELPRLLRILDEIGFPSERVSLVAVDNDTESIKRSPGGEEQGYEIYRVPTVVVSRGGVELSRIVEHPVLSLERDLHAILSESGYRPSYRSYPVIRRWLEQGLLSDPNVDPWGLAIEVRSTVAGEGELHAAARVLQSRGDLDEAVKLFRVNCALHRTSSSCQERLAAALLDSGDLDAARKAVERALRLNDDPERVGELTDMLGRTAATKTM